MPLQRQDSSITDRLHGGTTFQERPMGGPVAIIPVPRSAKKSSARPADYRDTPRPTSSTKVSLRSPDSRRVPSMESDAIPRHQGVLLSLGRSGRYCRDSPWLRPPRECASEYRGAFAAVGFATPSLVLFGWSCNSIGSRFPVRMPDMDAPQRTNG